MILKAIKVGDLVICLKSYNPIPYSPTIKGHVYKVEKYDRIYIKINGFHFFSDNFEKLQNITKLEKLIYNIPLVLEEDSDK